jgi:hypothetical protein
MKVFKRSAVVVGMVLAIKTVMKLNIISTRILKITV